MGKLLLAGIGGFVGSALRYSLSGFVQGLGRGKHFPYGTLAVNLLGCLAIGFLSQLVEIRGSWSAETRTLVFVGVLGGFTTFSAFGNETVNLWRGNENLLAALNIVAHLVLCVGAVWFSRAVALQVWR
jgi:fluoride exporter